MIVFTRKPNESIMIGDNIKITVVRVVGNRVKIAIDAPRDVEIHRAEVVEAKRELAGPK